MSELRAIGLKSNVKASFSCPGCRVNIGVQECKLCDLEALVSAERAAFDCPHCMGIGPYPFVNCFVDSVLVQYEKALVYLRDPNAIEADYESKTLCACGNRGFKAVIHTIDDFMICDACGLLLTQVGRLVGGTPIRLAADQRHLVAFKKFQYNMLKLLEVECQGKS